MAEPARIVLDSAVLAGKPVIRGTRLSVDFVIGLMADGWSEVVGQDSNPDSIPRQDWNPDPQTLATPVCKPL